MVVSQRRSGLQSRHTPRLYINTFTGDSGAWHNRAVRTPLLDRAATPRAALAARGQRSESCALRRGGAPLTARCPGGGLRSGGAKRRAAPAGAAQSKGRERADGTPRLRRFPDPEKPRWRSPRAPTTRPARRVPPTLAARQGNMPGPRKGPPAAGQRGASLGRRRALSAVPRLASRSAISPIGLWPRGSGRREVWGAVGLRRPQGRSRRWLLRARGAATGGLAPRPARLRLAPRGRRDSGWRPEDDATPQSPPRAGHRARRADRP